MARQRVVERVDEHEHRRRALLHLRDERRQVARIGHEHLRRADAHHEQAAGREGEDVIERQRRVHHVLHVRVERGIEPGFGLQDVRRHVGVGENGAFRDARRAARVLQERHVRGLDVGARQRRLRALARAPGQKAPETVRQRQVIGLHGLLHVARHEIDQHALGAEQVAHAHQHRAFELHAIIERLVERVRAHVGDEDHARAGIVDLAGQFARRVERIDVHHRVAADQQREQDDGAGGDVGHHHRDAVALAQAHALQRRREVAHAGFELAIGEGFAEALERDAIGKARDAGLEKIDEGRQLRGVDVVRHAGGVMRKPGTLAQGPVFVERAAHRLSSRLPVAPFAPGGPRNSGCKAARRLCRCFGAPARPVTPAA